MNIEFKTGKPQKDGTYVVVTKFEDVYCIPFTTEYGWNTRHSTKSAYAFPEDEVVAWAENFAGNVIDIYGRRDIMKNGGEQK